MGVASTSPARGRPRDPSRDDAILDAVIALLEEVGYDRASIDAIAERAGVGKATIYRRWPDGKAQLVVDAVVRRRPARPLADTGSLREDLLAAVRDAAERMAGASRLATGLACRMQVDAELAGRVREHLMDRERDTWRTIAARAVARGELACAPTTLFCDVAPSLLHGRIAFTGEPLDEPFVTELVDRVLLPVLRPTPPT